MVYGLEQDSEDLKGQGLEPFKVSVRGWGLRI